METAALTVRSTSHVSLQCPAAAAAPAHVQRWRRGASSSAAMPRRRRQPSWAGRVRALPSAEVINEILHPNLVPGSPSDTGDVSSLIPVSALMLLFYFVSNWVVPELLLKNLKEPKPEDDDKASSTAAAAAAASISADGADSPRKIRLKVKKKKNGKTTIVKV